MKIIKAKLVKGIYLEVLFHDGNADVNKSYPNTEAPPKLLKAFQALNHPLCELTEQFDKTGQLDYDNVVCRGYSFKGDGEKESFSLTGIRLLSNGKTLTIPKSPSLSSEEDDSYPKHDFLIKCLERCRDEINVFMENNKSSDEIQLRLYNTLPENVILKSANPGEQNTEEEIAERLALGEEVDVTDQYKTEQERMDDEEPVRIDKMSIKALKALGTPEAQEELQRRNADKNKNKK